jgi:hypothetical protein
LLRPVLISLFAAVALWVSGVHYSIVLVVAAYTASSLLLAAGFRFRRLGSSAVVYAGMVDTSLFLGAGTFLTGGPASPVLYLFFVLQATYLVLATPRTFGVTAVTSMAVMIIPVIMVDSGLALLNVDPTQQPLSYVVAAAGSLAMLSSVGRLRSVLSVTRTQVYRHLPAALNALHRLLSGDQREKQTATFLCPLMAALRVTDEGAIYQFDQNSGALLLVEGMGLRPWFQNFLVFWPEEGVVGQAYRLNKRVVYQDFEKLRKCYGNLSQRNLEILDKVARKVDPPNYTIAVPISWGDEVFGVLVLSRQLGSLNDREIELVEGFAAHMATVMHGAPLRRPAAGLDQNVGLHNQFLDLLQAVSASEDGFQEFAQQLRGLIDFEGIRIPWPLAKA